MSNSLRIIFMGTPEFAVPSLQLLLDSPHEVVAVITAPDRPAGRGQKLTESPVKQCAIANGVPVLQPEKLKNPAFLATLRTLNADLQVVVAFRMLPEVVWAMPRQGTFNLHASLLPDYRGAAPINWAIMQGETETGVTTFFLEKEIDTGKIIFQEKQPIAPDDTAGTLYERLMQQGAQLVLRTVQAIAAGSYPQIPQPDVREVKDAPKLFRETCAIDWNRPAAEIRNFVRGLSPYPAAWTTLNGLTCKLYDVSPVNSETEGTLQGDALTVDVSPGIHRTDQKTYLHFKAGDQWVAVHDIQLEGKRRMKVEELLRGLKL